MTIWDGEIKELGKLYGSFKGQIPDIVKELEQLIKTDDANVVMLYSRRCLEVIITDLCETELQRPRKTEPLKGIIDKLNSEEKVPGHIITSMLSLNSMATYGAHPKDFDPEQVKPVLNNLAIIIKWYLKYKDFQIVSKTDQKDEKPAERKQQEFKAPVIKKTRSKKSKKGLILLSTGLFLVLLVFFSVRILAKKKELEEAVKYMSIEAYRTVTIGDQVWMAENLKTTFFNDGTPIPLVKDEKEWDRTTPAYCWFENNRKRYMETYGPLYNWFTVNTGKLCPLGWHVPSAAEWTKLTKFLGDSIPWKESGDSVILIPQLAGMKLKEAGNLHWAANDTIHATDQYGFRALPGGARFKQGTFFDISYQGSWWSSTEDDHQDAKNCEMSSDQNGVTEIQQYKQFGMSVRCIKNKD
jgi:uncharacterized protein (TIGR02145 family)